MRNLSRSASVLAFASAAIAASAQNLVQNSGFETGLLAPWTGNNVAVANGSSHTGTYSGEINDVFQATPSTLSQSLVTAPGAYTVSFWVRSLNTADATFTASFGATTLLTLTNPASFDYTLYTYTATTATPTTVLSFTVNSQSRIFRIDDVTVQAVPEPSALAALAIPALGLMKRRKRA